jgi:AAA+ ATPase superfamily predicted ATPase
MPPHLAGREDQLREFERIVKQDPILTNVIVTGLRGVGKTVLLEKFKPLAQQQGWIWVGSDFSESAALTEDMLAVRLLTDLAVATSNLVVDHSVVSVIGFRKQEEVRETRLDYPTLLSLYRTLPGLTSDKLKRLLEIVWRVISEQSGQKGNRQIKGILFAYDEAQTMADHGDKEQYPVSVLLDTYQSLQRQGFPFMLMLVGLPTLFPKLVEARTYAERMFHIIELKRLDETSSRDAILVPLKGSEILQVSFRDNDVNLILDRSAGYPYFIQFICREAFDALVEDLRWVFDDDDSKDLLKVFADSGGFPIPIDAIVNKLDSDFFTGRWARTTDRQRDLLIVISTLENCDLEFTVQEIVDQSRSGSQKPFGSSRVNQMLNVLAQNGLIYKNRHGKYSFAVPLMGQFIRRKIAQSDL